MEATNNSSSVDQADDYGKRLGAITNAQIVSFLEKNTKNHNCPNCNQTSWGVVNSEQDFTGMLALPKSGGMSVPPPMIPLAMVSCQHCGYVKSFALAKVLEKIENAEE